MIKDIFESVMKYLIWALAAYILAKLFGNIFLYFLSFIESGIFSTPMKMLIGGFGSLFAIVMITVGSLGIAGGISKLICLNLLKFDSLKNDSFALPDFEKIFKQTPEEKGRQEKESQNLESKRISETKNSDDFRRYKHIINEIHSLRNEKSSLTISVFDNSDDRKRIEYKNRKIEEKIEKLLSERMWLESKICSMPGGRDLLRELDW